MDRVIRVASDFLNPQSVTLIGNYLDLAYDNDVKRVWINKRVASYFVNPQIVTLIGNDLHLADDNEVKRVWFNNIIKKKKKNLYNKG